MFAHFGPENWQKWLKIGENRQKKCKIFPTLAKIG
jgi:hypothetical protein